MERFVPGETPLRCTVEYGDPENGLPPVLFLHGFGSSHELNWVRAGWPAALQGRTLIGLDLRGHGGSGRPHRDGAYAPAEIAADAERVLDALDTPRADLLAYSMGSRNAWELALRRPERVRRAVLAGFGPRDPFAGADLDRLDTDPSPFGRLFQSVLELPGNEPGALAACARGQAAHPFTAEPAPEAPLLFVAGERDAIAEGVEELAAGCGAPVVRVPGRTHANAVSARAFKEAVRDFLAREPSGAVSEPQGGGPRA
ncbi:alpha/beta fold hydrolase [Nocardiopsis composta]|uniref:Pimeloyl-ACP methyl ester carboxylesterase n=1 Tax=Nocardiopsis composta TaxID=157465 RepID=A0A7W8QMN3_9ACTN|nr:alpha/beta hydrolase [Nocardiopsis composta]MBB5432246.1 pimeloyl-ACP methyl ester carboxylesterase [Nocardiopsis composta]